MATKITINLHCQLKDTASPANDALKALKHLRDNGIKVSAVFVNNEPCSIAALEEHARFEAEERRHNKLQGL